LFRVIFQVKRVQNGSENLLIQSIEVKEGPDWTKFRHLGKNDHNVKYFFGRFVIVNILKYFNGFCYFLKLPQVNNDPIGENLPNLVTLFLKQFGRLSDKLLVALIK
jgi:hypothetical protein